MSIPPDVHIYPKDLRLMSARELVAHFGSKNSRRVVLTRLMRALVIQGWRQIQAGDEPPVQGNLRTFWYRWVKPTLSRLGRRHQPKSDPYDAMLAAFGWVIAEQGWARYKDFDLTDENWAHRFIGATRPDVLVFSEKRGWIRFLRRCHEDLGTSALALGGAPSALTSEYTTDDLLAVLAPDQPVSLLGIVDYDPSGHAIAHAFARQLRTSGLEVNSLELLVQPHVLTPLQLELGSVLLPAKQTTLNQRCMDKTGGVDGQLLGIESEAVPWHKLNQLIQEHLGLS